MRFRRIVHDGVRLTHQLVHQCRIANIAFDQPKPVRVQPL